MEGNYNYNVACLMLLRIIPLREIIGNYNITRNNAENMRIIPLREMRSIAK